MSAAPWACARAFAARKAINRNPIPLKGGISGLDWFFAAESWFPLGSVFYEQGQERLLALHYLRSTRQLAPGVALLVVSTNLARSSERE